MFLQIALSRDGRFLAVTTWACDMKVRPRTPPFSHCFILSWMQPHCAVPLPLIGTCPLACCIALQSPEAPVLGYGALSKVVSGRIELGFQLILFVGIVSSLYISECVCKRGPCVLQLWELSWARDKSFTGCTRAMELKGHTSGITCVAFNAAATRAATSSKDGHLRIWKLDVRCTPRLQC